MHYMWGASHFWQRLSCFTVEPGDGDGLEEAQGDNGAANAEFLQQLDHIGATLKITLHTISLPSSIMCNVGWEICREKWISFLNLESAYICKGAQRAQKANHYQAEDKKFAPVVEMVRVFVQHSRDDGLQSPELKSKEARSLIPCGKSAWKRRKPDLFFGSVPCCPAPAWSSSQRRW